MLFSPAKQRHRAFCIWKFEKDGYKINSAVVAAKIEMRMRVESWHFSSKISNIFSSNWKDWPRRDLNTQPSDLEIFIQETG